MNDAKKQLQEFTNLMDEFQVLLLRKDWTFKELSEIRNKLLNQFANKKLFLVYLETGFGYDQSHTVLRGYSSKANAEKYADKLNKELIINHWHMDAMDRSLPDSILFHGASLDYNGGKVYVTGPHEMFS